MTGTLKVLWLIPGLFLGSFLPWYFFEEPRRIVQTYFAYAKAFMEVISIKFLLLTLISPWKSIKDEYSTKGFNLTAFLQSVTLNITSRVIGFLFRIVALSIGIVIQLILIVIFSAYLALWFAYPFAFIAVITFFRGTPL